MRPSLRRPNTIQGPPSGNPTENSMQILSRKLPNVVEHQALPDIEYRIAPVETGNIDVCAITIATSGTGSGSCCIVPRRAVVDGMAPGVIDVEQHAMAHLLLQRRLQTVVSRVIRVFPLP